MGNSRMEENGKGKKNSIPEIYYDINNPSLQPQNVRSGNAAQSK